MTVRPHNESRGGEEGEVRNQRTVMNVDEVPIAVGSNQTGDSFEDQLGVANVPPEPGDC